MLGLVVEVLERRDRIRTCDLGALLEAAQHVDSRGQSAWVLVLGQDPSGSEWAAVTLSVAPHHRRDECLGVPTGGDLDLDHLGGARSVDPVR